MNAYVVDSSAWVEYFSGSESGKKAANIIDDEKNKLFTTVITLAELSSFFKRNNRDFEKAHTIILKNSKIILLNEGDAKELGKLHAEAKIKNKKLSFADSFVLFVAKKYNAKIITKDLDFRNYKEVIFI